MQSTIFMVVIIVVMIGFMWWQSRKQKQRQQDTVDWRNSLAPGTEVATVSGLLGVIKEVDAEHDQVVIDSEGSLSRWRIQAITKPPIVPAYVSDDEVDEDGNPLPKDDEDSKEDDADDKVQTPAIDSSDSDSDATDSDATDTDTEDASSSYSQTSSSKDSGAKESPSGPIDSAK